MGYLNRDKYLKLRDSGVGTATGYVSDGPGLTDRGGVTSRIRPEGHRGPHCLLYTGYWLYFREVKRPERGVVHPPLSRAEVKERLELYLYLTPALS